MTQHVSVRVTQIGDWKVERPRMYHFSYSSMGRICHFCRQAIEPKEIHFLFGGARYCIGCVKYD